MLEVSNITHTCLDLFFPCTIVGLVPDFFFLPHSRLIETIKYHLPRLYSGVSRPLTHDYLNYISDHDRRGFIPLISKYGSQQTKKRFV